MELATEENRSWVLFSAEIEVSEMPLWVSCGTAGPIIPARTTAPNKGFLEDGTSYVVYRFAHYADGFKQLKYLSDTRSVTGFYILSSGLKFSTRKSPAGASVVSLIPRGQDPITFLIWWDRIW